MATPAPSNEFQRLRLNTKHTNSSQDFPFALSSDADHVASSAFSSPALFSPDVPDRDDQQHQQARTRRSSVSFHEYATLDDGRKHSLSQPLSRPAEPRRHSTRDSYMSEDPPAPASAPAAPDDSPYTINPFTGEPRKRRSRRSEIAPKLETIDSHDTAQLPSLTSASSGSLLSDQLRSPDTLSNSYFAYSSAMTSYSPVVSPSMGSGPWTMMPRNKTLSRTASLRNTSRRSSRFSGSSMSPASQASGFLSLFGKGSSATAPPEPDEEGQSIGVDNEYVIGSQIGSGGFSVVKEVFSMADDGRRTKQAVKIVRKIVPHASEAENELHQQTMEREIGVWRYLQHPHILQLHTSFVTDFATYCIMDLVDSGSLHDHIFELRKSGQKGMDSELAKIYAFQLGSALRYMHEDLRIVHRDVKLENCLIQAGRQDSHGILKLADFGLAEFVNNDMTESVRSLDSNDSDSFKDPAGTLEYAAPELLNGTESQIQPSIDMWAYGVCIYTMVTGSRPFHHSIQFRVAELIAAGKWDVQAIRDSPAGKDHFDDIYELLDGCLKMDAAERWTIADVMTCSWFSGLKDLSTSDEGWEFMENTPSQHS
jgi:serine/threonine protein kinase